MAKAMNKTFAELGYNVGDTVRCVDGGSGYYYEKGCEYLLGHTEGEPTIRGDRNGYSGLWELVSRAGSANADDGYLNWSDMTPEAQGALLLAYHNGPTIKQSGDEFKWVDFNHKPMWLNAIKYRVKPADPVVVTHEIFGSNELFWGYLTNDEDTHKMTYNTIDGVIDCASVKMMEIDKP